MQQFCYVIESSWIDMLFCIVPYQNHMHIGRPSSWADVTAGFWFLKLFFYKVTPTACSFIHPSPMPCQEHTLSLYIWFWYATSNHFDQKAKLLVRGYAGGIKATTVGPDKVYLHCQISFNKSKLIACSIWKVYIARKLMVLHHHFYRQRLV